MSDDQESASSSSSSARSPARTAEDELLTRRAALTDEQRQHLTERLRGGQKRKAIPPADRSAPLALSFGQERVWLHQELNPASILFHRPVQFRIKGDLQPTALESSLRELVRRHESLRTVIRPDGDYPVQEILLPKEFACPVFDLTTEQHIEGALEQHIAREVRRPFALSREIPFRAQLYRLAQDDYCLLILLHHVAMDAWSESVLARELSALYAAFAGGQSPSLADLPIQYPDYAAWQRLLPNTAAFCRSVQYWQDQLRELPALELPTDRQRLAAPGEAGESIPFRLQPELMARLKELARRQNATVFMILLSAWATLLQRCSGQNDLVIGCPVAGRTHPEFEPLIGLFVNTLPLRITLSATMTFQDLLQTCRQVVLASMDHQAVPLQEIIRTAVLPQGRTGSAGFDAVFIHERLPEAKYCSNGVSFEVTPHFDDAAGADIVLEVTERTHDIIGQFCFRLELWNRTSMQRMADRFLVLLNSICAAPQTPLQQLQLLSADEYRQVVFEWNQTQREDATRQSLIELFELWADKAPDAAAIRFQGRTVSYGELNREANRLSQWLRRHGAAPDSLVAICVDRSPAMVAALLAILKSGAAYLPLDPSHPDDRLHVLLSEAGVQCVLTESAHAAKLQSASLKVFCLDRDAGLWADSSAANPPSVTQPDHLAYVIFTSGSTGKPKGVEILHRGVVNFLLGMQDILGIAAGQTVLAITTITFDISVLELFLPLVSGGAIELVPRELSLDGFRFKDVIDRSPATILQGTPTTWRMLLEAGWTGDPRFTVLTGGEHLPHDLAHALLDRAGSVWNVYGPTETTVWCTGQKIEPGFDRIAVGRPLRNTRAFVLDRHLQPQPIGVTGELYLGGEGLARGYRRRLDLTAEQFVPVTFQGQSDSRLYRTGDAARFLHDGIIELLGRMDHQIKWRGYRIEPGEIESIFCAQEAVSAAAVVLTGDSHDQQRLTAYLVADLQRVSQAELRELARRRLPDYMLPASYVFLERMPKTPSGKIDRRALPRPETESSVPREIASPGTPTEKLLADIWREVLGTSEIGRDDSFFDLGGHSLLVLRVARRLDRFGWQAAPVALLFQYPVLADFAQAFDDLQRDRGADPIQEVVAGSVATPFFVFSGLGGEHHYLRHLIKALKFPGAVNVINWHLAPAAAEVSSLVELAIVCADLIQSVQPHGPYFLGGFSFGGPLVFETARQLTDAGHSVRVVAILDSGIKRTTPFTLRERGEFVVRFFQNLPRWLIDDFLRQSPGHMLGRVRRKLKQWLRQFLNRPADPAANRPKQLDELFEADIFPKVVETRMQADLNLAAGYRPKPAPVHITLFRARIRPLLRNLFDDLGWRQYALGGVEIIEVPGHHHTMMVPPFVNETARQLSAVLQTAMSAPAVELPNRE